MDKKKVLISNSFVMLFLIFSIHFFEQAAFVAEAKEEAEISPTEKLLLGSWSRYNNRIYTLLIIRANGNWTSDLRIEGATSKIVERKGESTGTWKLEGNNLIMTVLSSQMEDVWPTGTFPLEIISIDEKTVTLKYPNSRLVTWKKARVEKEKKEGAVNPVIPMKPIVVNLNKTSSKDKDRYLCVALELHLEEIPVDTPIPKIHPRAWDSTILYLSSLLYNDVKTFDEMKVVTERLTKMLNPYFNGLLAEIASTHIMVSSSMEKAEEFILTHSPPPVLETTEGEKEEGEKKEEEKEGDKEKDESKEKEKKK